MHFLSSIVCGCGCVSCQIRICPDIFRCVCFVVHLLDYTNTHRSVRHVKTTLYHSTARIKDALDGILYYTTTGPTTSI